MDTDTLIQRRTVLPCPGCARRTVEFPPGVLDREELVEVRTCPHCGTTVETEPVFHHPLAS